MACFKNPWGAPLENVGLERDKILANTFDEYAVRWAQMDCICGAGATEPELKEPV